MENLNSSDTGSTQILGDWEFDEARSNSPKEVEKKTDTRGSTSSVAAGEGKGKEAARRVLPPWMDPSYEWGGGKWKEDGRKMRKKKKESESESESESDEIPFKEVIEALLRNSGEKKVEEEEEEKGEEKNQKNCVEMLKAMGLKFP